MPDWVGADIERRAVDREARETTRYARRASWTAKAWAAFAAITPAFAAAAGDWLWLSVGGAALVNGGLWAQEAIRARRRTPELPVPRQPAPSAAALRGSAAAGPLRRGEAAMRAFTSLLKAAPPGAAEDALRSGMAAAAEVVDGLRVRASSVVACEGAARALTNPAGRAELDSTIQELVTEMEAAVRALDDLLGAAAEVVGVARASAARAGQDVIAGTPTGRLGPGQLGAASLGPDLAALSERAASLRAYAAGLRELTTDPTTAKAFPPPTQPPAG
ncbi:MAG: hypothetical protein IRZ08_06050 [Frankia sp.]|nr:hypothetical protein [Frankia sp.]